MIKPREWMTQQRQAQKLTYLEMAKKADVSSELLEMLELNQALVTHPIIAERIADAYGMSADQQEGLLPENRRPHSDKYDPNKYVKPLTFHQQVDYMKLEEKDND